MGNSVAPKQNTRSVPFGTIATLPGNNAGETITGIMTSCIIHADEGVCFNTSLYFLLKNKNKFRI
ncbi:hypothetical protein UA45_04060 [Morganella morganii]|uniref:Uncharacterized protein n=1 Tax=Morganella morganii TaxID=582 RepID=A0A0D8LCA5_MORMO|nr:hypothetical protein UA45_04060 [Morganella morganii]